MHAYIIILYTVKSEMVEEQNQKFEDEKKTIEKQMQKLQELSGNVICYEIIKVNNNYYLVIIQ